VSKKGAQFLTGPQKTQFIIISNILLIINYNLNAKYAILITMDNRKCNEFNNELNEKRANQMSAVQKEGFELFKKKNADYGDAFAKYGTVGVIMRMGDKIQRLVSISKTGINLIETETLRDTLIDLHNYSAMAIMLLDETDEIDKKDIDKKDIDKKDIDKKDIDKKDIDKKEREMIDYLT
jgi:hypothetical protein